MAIVAQYPGTCGTCGEHFDAGATILPLDSGGWAHFRCPDPTKLRPGEVVCTECFMVKAADGSCGCGGGLMPRDPRPYVTYPVGYTDHPRLALLSDSAFRVFHLMNDYSREYGLDGKFTFEIAKRWPKRALNELAKGIDDRPLVVVTEDRLLHALL